MTKNFVTTAAFLGLPNVGKSTLLNALVGEKIAPTTRKPQTTRRIIRGIKTVDNYQQIYFDTPGVLRKVTGLDQFMHAQIKSALNDVEQLVLIVDAKSQVSANIDMIKRLEQSAEKNNQHVILVINKIDTLKDKSVLLELISQYASNTEIKDIVPVSAMNKDGLDDLFNCLNQKAQEKDFLFAKDFFTDASEREIVAELIREKVMLELTDELPYKIAVTIDYFDEERREDEKKPLVTIEGIIHVERKSQKPIVIGSGGQTLKTIGTRARKDLERLLSCQVMLKLFVRVEEDWTTSAKGLRKLGY